MLAKLYVENLRPHLCAI